MVYPHDLAIGGSLVKAADLAAGIAAAGHEVIISGIQGPLAPYIEQRGQRFISARRLKYRPAPSRIARRERLDLIHANEWPPCLDAHYGAGLLVGVPVLSTVLGMSVSPYVLTTVALIVGTADLGVEARKVQRGNVWEENAPLVDVVTDHPGIDGLRFREAHGMGHRELLILPMSRLAVDLQLDALVRATDAADMLAARYPIRLMFIGGSPAHDAPSERAATVNRRRGRKTVTLPGSDVYPRPAYAAADVVVGMGRSALRWASTCRRRPCTTRHRNRAIVRAGRRGSTAE